MFNFSFELNAQLPPKNLWCVTVILVFRLKFYNAGAGCLNARTLHIWTHLQWFSAGQNMPNIKGTPCLESRTCRWPHQMYQQHILASNLVELQIHGHIYLQVSSPLLVSHLCAVLNIHIFTIPSVHMHVRVLDNAMRRRDDVSTNIAHSIH